MRPSSRRLTGIVLSLCAFSIVTLTGCSDTSRPGSSNRGSGSAPGAVTIENAFIVPTFVPGHCAIQQGTGGRLRFTVSNARPAGQVRLDSIYTEAVADSNILVGVDIPAKSSIGFGQPSAAQVDQAGAVPAVRLDVIDPGLRPGMSADMTFRFDQADDVTMAVPVEACPTQDR
ncbi:hypothetical protein MCHUDSM44219_04455 [Mycolicibacterium chubuense]|uniref:Copper chaperone PCu(A)C n=2 Tax=Mycolicibacterium chubuense TaxID=1800 RepID=A0A0J6VUZ2_MYCCU|nr:hypothetical protein MCHUDSM44219_04455 [Mycolicibacterium chubuense]SPX98812.1 Uncharacterised protein [Mycolicibacterium chubuense]